MTTQLIRLGMLFALSFAASTAAARSLPPTDAQCAFDLYAPLSVVEHTVTEDFGLGPYRRLRGARVFVAAKPGLSARALTIRLQREFKQKNQGSLAGMCRPNVREVETSVVAGAGGFWVELSTADERSAASVLSWAKRGLPAEHFAASASR